MQDIVEEFKKTVEERLHLEAKIGRLQRRVKRLEANEADLQQRINALVEKGQAKPKVGKVIKRFSVLDMIEKAVNKAGGVVSIEDIQKGLGVDYDVARNNLGRTWKRGSIKKVEDGKYCPLDFDPDKEGMTE